MGGTKRSRKRQVSLWHEGFADCFSERAPPSYQIISEYELSRRPRRADLLLLRRLEEPNRDHEGRILRRLWPRLAKHTLLEFKSPSREFARGDLINLNSYGGQYHARHLAQFHSNADLTLVLVTPCDSDELRVDLDQTGWTMRDLGGGYATIAGLGYATFVVFTDQVAEAERDDFLRIFSHHEVQTQQARDWLKDYIIMKDGHALQHREGYDAMLQKFLRSLPAEQRLAGLPAEEVLRHYKPAARLAGLPAEEVLRHYKPAARLAGLPAKDRLAGLPAKDLLLALPNEVLRELSDDYVRSLPKRVQTEIRKRLGK